MLWSIVGDASVDEGGTAQYTISLDGILQSGDDASVVLSLADLETAPGDYAKFLATVQTAVTVRPDLAFDPATGRLTATGTGAMTADLVIELAAVDDTFVEGPERYQVLLSNSTGASAGINPTQSIVTTLINDTVGDGGEPETALWSIGGDQTVPEGSQAIYELSLAGTLQAGEVVTVELKINDIDTISADYANFNNACQTACIANRNQEVLDSFGKGIIHGAQ